MKELFCDIAVIGGGAAGLTAGARCAESGKHTLIVEREEEPGGVLRQCIHSGFGVHFFREELTGPEYAARVLSMARKAGAEFLCGTTVLKLENAGEERMLTVCSRARGVERIHARAVILAMGCRERCRGNLGIPGDRIAGVFNAGTAQQLLNLEGYLPGKKAVIVGSGDIGLIMARRLSWCGVKVQCVVEIMPYPAGLSRNIAQCLEDFGIPLYLSSTVTGIHGRSRVESVTFAPLADGRADLTREQRVECDTVLFSVGLIPENELTRECGAELNPLTGGAAVDGSLMTTVPGVFACGNVLHVHDLVDFVSEEALRCAGNAVRFCDGETGTEKQFPVTPGENVRYVVPNRATPGEENRFFLRSRKVMEKACLRITSEGNTILQKELRYVKPAEMISVPLAAGKFSEGITIALEERK